MNNYLRRKTHSAPFHCADVHVSGERTPCVLVLFANFILRWRKFWLRNISPAGESPPKGAAAAAEPARAPPIIAPNQIIRALSAGNVSVIHGRKGRLSGQGLLSILNEQLLFVVHKGLEEKNENEYRMDWCFDYCHQSDSCRVHIGGITWTDDHSCDNQHPNIHTHLHTNKYARHD